MSKYMINSFLSIYQSKAKNSIDTAQMNFVYKNYQLYVMDIDDQLQMLQRELMAVQEQKSNPLSERTVAEIMVKLHHEGFSFYPTTDNNEYVTPEQLDKQLISLVKERRKINLGIIPQILNIGIDTIESRIHFILQKGNISRHANNLISNKYFDQLIAGLRQRLEHQGKIDLQQIAIEHQLNIVFVQKLINENIQQFSAQLTGNQLITKQYTLLKKSKVLGFLGALNNPISLETFIKTTGIENKNIEETILQLINQKRLKGKYQSSYYVPDRFTANQKKIITQFYENNGFIDADMLQKKFLVSKPQQWLNKNLAPGSFVKIEKVYFKPQKLQSFGVQANSLLKSDGFVQLSHVLPIALEDKNLNYFLEEYCHLKDYFVCEGYCYSNQWLQRLTNEFKQKIIYNIFFKKADPKNSKKKGGKKEKNEQLTEEDLQQTLFNCGFAQYSVAQTLAPQLLPLINERIEQLKKKVQKELAQNKGFINTNFLKYKSGKTILRTQQSFTRMINIIQKQQKKQKWIDFEFGPNQNDKNGQYSLIYYDNAVPKGWPSLQNLKWVEFNPKDLLQADSSKTGQSLKKSHLSSLLEIIDFHNSKSVFKIPQPELNRLNEQSISPFTYKFFISQKQCRYVIVDDKLPLVDQKIFGSFSRYAYAEKAYAKLRYCYKGTLNIGIQQLIMEVTGKQSLKHVVQNEKDKQKILPILQEHLKVNNLILLLGEGENDKKLKLQDQQTQFFSSKLYYLYVSDKQLQIYPPVPKEIQLKVIVELFKNIFVIAQ